MRYLAAIFDTESSDLYIEDSLSLQRMFNRGEIPEGHTALAVYRFEAPDDLDDLNLTLIGRGLFFMHDWSADKTISFVQREDF